MQANQGLTRKISSDGKRGSPMRCVVAEYGTLDAAETKRSKETAFRRCRTEAVYDAKKMVK